MGSCKYGCDTSLPASLLISVFVCKYGNGRKKFLRNTDRMERDFVILSGLQCCHQFLLLELPIRITQLFVVLDFARWRHDADDRDGAG